MRDGKDQQNDMQKQFAQAPIPVESVDLHVADGWHTVGAPYVDIDPATGRKRKMQMIRRNIRTHAI